MDITAFLTTSLGAAVILGYLSLVFYKENPWSRWAEYSLVGLGAAWGVIVTTWTLYNTTITAIAAGDILLIVPFILGLLTYTQFTKYRWLLRWPLAIVSSVGLTLTLTGIPTDLFIVQLRAVAVPLTVGSSFDILNAIFIVIAVLTILTYFTFTHEHTGALGYSTRIGRLIMMLALGGGFGMAILSQGTFLLNILTFLVRDWLHILA